MGEGYIRRTSPPNFPLKTHGLPYPSIQNARVSLSAARRGVFGGGVRCLP